MELTPEGWLIVPVADNVIRRAQAMRARRDQDFGNIFEEEATDLRWVGEVGEICMHGWLRDAATGQGVWMRRRPAGKPDFQIHGHMVGMKTVKRQVAFRPEYTAQITASHAAEKVGFFFFASYEQPRQWLWLLGGISRTDFLRDAMRYEAGEKVHPHYKIRKRHAIYNIEARFLTPPAAWLQQLEIHPPEG